MAVPIEGVTPQNETQNVPQTSFAEVAAKTTVIQAQVGSAVGAASVSEVKVRDLEQLRTDPRLKAVYKAITEGIARSIIKSAQRSQERLERAIREARERDRAG